MESEENTPEAPEQGDLTPVKEAFDCDDEHAALIVNLLDNALNNVLNAAIMQSREDLMSVVGPLVNPQPQSGLVIPK